MRNPLALGILATCVIGAGLYAGLQPRFACACVGIVVMVGVGLFYHVREEI
jgi:uncharacterized membrane protein YphA (DoxX/SURF4 family)